MEYLRLAVLISSLYPIYGFFYSGHISNSYFAYIVNIITLVLYSIVWIFQLITIVNHKRIKRNDYRKWMELHKTNYLILTLTTFGLFSEFLMILISNQKMKVNDNIYVNLIAALLVYVLLSYQTVQIYNFQRRFKIPIYLLCYKIILTHIHYFIFSVQICLLQIFTQSPQLIISLGITIYIIYEIFKKEFSVIGDNKKLSKYYYLIVVASLLVNLFEVLYVAQTYLTICSLINLMSLINLSDQERQNQLQIDEPLMQGQNVMFITKTQCDYCAQYFKSDDKISYFTTCSHIRHSQCENDFDCFKKRCSQQYLHQDQEYRYKVNMQMVNQFSTIQFKKQKQIFLMLPMIIVCQLSAIMLIFQQDTTTIMWIQIFWISPQLFNLCGKIVLFLKYNFQRQFQSQILIKALFQGVWLILFCVNMCFKYLILSGNYDKVESQFSHPLLKFLIIIILDSLLAFFQLDYGIYSKNIPIPTIVLYVKCFLQNSNINNLVIYGLTFTKYFEVFKRDKIYLYVQTTFYLIISLMILLFDLGFQLKSAPRLYKFAKYFYQMALVSFTFVNLQYFDQNNQLSIYQVCNLLLIIRLSFYKKFNIRIETYRKIDKEKEYINMAQFVYRDFQQQTDKQCQRCDSIHYKNQELVYFVFCQHQYHKACISLNKDQQTYNCPICEEAMRFQDRPNQFLHLQQI